jgi:hypothetical protein
MKLLVFSDMWRRHKPRYWTLYAEGLGTAKNVAEAFRDCNTAGLLLLILAVTAVFSSWQTNAEWVNDYYGHALDALMQLQKKTGTFVAYRSHRDYRRTASVGHSEST